MTAVAIRRHVCARDSRERRRRNTTRLSTRWPSTASSAGSVTTATRADNVATAIPATAIERRTTIGNTRSADIAAASVAAENATVRPAVQTVVVTAASTVAPLR